MGGIPPEIMTHKLNISPFVKPVRSKKRTFAPDRNKAITDEVEQLLQADILEEVFYPTWLSNPVMVRKPDSSWRMCVDYTDLNKACPKDCHPLPAIEQKVDALIGFRIKCFLDAYKGITKY